MNQPLSPSEWNALDEEQRIALVEADHERTRSPTGGRADAHAAIHVVVENRLADGDAAVTRAYDRFRAAGVSRHQTIHALASVVTHHMVAVLESSGAPDQAEADRDFDALDPAAFVKK